jgi:guanylate kinase
MKKKLSNSVLITGASVTGKTTLYRCLVVHFGLLPTPVHMTRAPRDGEIWSLDGVFMSEEEFKKRFHGGDYMQESLESAYYGGAYYGCPKEWIDSTLRGDYNCFVCPTVKMAKKIKEALGPNIIWIHLVANKSVRRARLLNREPDLDKKKFTLRIEQGDTPVDIAGYDLLINTSYLKAGDIFLRALNHL